MRSWPVAILLASVLASCTTRRSSEPAQADKSVERFQSSDETRATRGLAAAAPPAPADQLPSSATAMDSVAPSMVIRTGNASIEVDTLEPAIARLRQLAARLGGYIANTTMQGGKHQLRQATLELKVPAARFDDLTTGLTPLGDVEYVNVTSEDVGEEFTDVTARVANARRLEERLVDLLATRTGKLQDVLAVERELARVRETIERYEGRLRYLRGRVALSTLSVTLHETSPVLGNEPGHNVIVDAFLRAWRHFVSVIATFIASLGFLVPLAAVLGVGIFLWRRYRKP